MIEHKGVFAELYEFFLFFCRYLNERLVAFGVRFEKTKDIFVAFLIVKRGKYSQSFLNTSFFLLISATVIGGPVIAENNPFINDYFSQEEDETRNVLFADIYSLPFKTTISQKPRDRIVKYKVKKGDTLASISNKFDISIQTIKWENKLKSDTIKENQILQILPVTGVAHKVKSGENIYSIAKKYKTEAQQIANFPFNDFIDIDTFAISSGQILIVPNGVIEAAKPIPRRQISIPKIAVGKRGRGKFIWPTSGSISQFPVWYHMALDIANKSLPGVLASDGGTVSYVARQRYGYGRHIIVDHGNGMQTLYAHLSEIYVSVGQSISQGQEIGRVGSTGRSTGPHLHFEIRENGRLVNPLNYLP